MKVDGEVVNVKPAFEPIKLGITFETEEELGMFYALFNHSYIIDAVNGSNNTNNHKLKCSEIREKIASLLGQRPNYHDAHNRLSQVTSMKSW
jgi:hypothetical protein